MSTWSPLGEYPHVVSRGECSREHPRGECPLWGSKWRMSPVGIEQRMCLVGARDLGLSKCQDPVAEYCRTSDCYLTIISSLTTTYYATLIIKKSTTCQLLYGQEQQRQSRYIYIYIYIITTGSLSLYSDQSSVWWTA